VLSRRWLTTTTSLTRRPSRYRSPCRRPSARPRVGYGLRPLVRRVLCPSVSRGLLAKGGGRRHSRRRALWLRGGHREPVPAVPETGSCRRGGCRLHALLRTPLLRSSPRSSACRGGPATDRRRTPRRARPTIPRTWRAIGCGCFAASLTRWFRPQSLKPLPISIAFSASTAKSCTSSPEIRSARPTMGSRWRALPAKAGFRDATAPITRCPS
jgi:hypothetical protein